MTHHNYLNSTIFLHTLGTINTLKKNNKCDVCFNQLTKHWMISDLSQSDLSQFKPSHTTPWANQKWHLSTEQGVNFEFKLDMDPKTNKNTDFFK